MYHRNSAIISGAALLIMLAAPMSRAASDASDSPQSGQQTQAPSRLQVTGSSRQFSVEADHAEIQSALKAIFVQAGKQFDLDNSVAGQITLKLDNQPLDTVLSSVARQTFLKYHLDSLTGIYHFEQDTEAVKAAFTHLNALNSQLRQQLRDIGLDLPGDTQLDGALNKLNTNVQAQNRDQNGAPADVPHPAGALGFAGSGGRNTPGNGASLKSDAVDKGSPVASAGGQIGQEGAAAKAARGAAGPPGQAGISAPNSSYKNGVLDTGSVPDYLVEQLLQAYGLNTNRQSGITVDKAVGDYLRQNSLVAINTHGAAVPVTDVLAELSRQSGVPILLDPMVPRGPRFRITLSLPACSLEDALKLILPPARLQSRIINNRVYVTPTPEFQIFYGSAPVPYVIYGASANPRVQQNLQQNGAPK